VILFVSALLRSTVGFGDALVAMPLLSLVLAGVFAEPMKFATPLVGLLAIFLGGILNRRIPKGKFDNLVYGVLVVLGVLLLVNSIRW